MSADVVEKEAATSAVVRDSDQKDGTTSVAGGGNGADLTTTVAKHYNELQEGGLAERAKSRIFYMRNFNNWIKSVLINQFMSRVKEQRARDSPLTVLDLCSGKGGDLLKWRKANIDKLVCADIAETSVQQCEERYKDMTSRARHDRHQNNSIFSAEFHAEDCTKTRLKDVYEDRDTMFDLVSCQFSFHYCFESLPQADMMIRNACECLKPGGYFIGTTPNSYELVKRARNAPDKRSFGNDVYNVRFVAESTDSLPLFGAKYDFHLEGVVDCPEFLVFFPAFEKLAEKYGMKLVYRKPFAEYFKEHLGESESRSLLSRMQALESYPDEEGTPLSSSNPQSYTAAKDHVDKLLAERHENDRRQPRIGTLSQEEWEALTVYTTFAFQKVDPSSSAQESSSLPEQNPETTNAPTHQPTNSPSKRKREHGRSSLEEGQIGSGTEGSGEEGPSPSKVARQT